jgi:Cu-Zn family superoxide dismutase
MRRMRRTLCTILFIAAAAAGCKKSGSTAATTPHADHADHDMAAPPAAEAHHATATIAAASGSHVAGTIELVEVAGGVTLTAKLTGLTPGEHGFHIHEKGDCSAADATSAGGHWNPEKHAHGSPDAAEHHMGDAGNLTASADGTVDQTITLHGASLGDGEDSAIGKGFIIHDKVDDFTTQPTGNAGARVGCGVITKE